MVLGRSHERAFIRSVRLQVQFVTAMTQTNKHLVFVYGTLKRGEPNFHAMANPETGVAGLIGTGETMTKYPLVVGTEYNIPFVLQVEGEGEHVEGEIWEVDDEKLASLDELERHPHVYRRDITKITVTDDSASSTASQKSENSFVSNGQQSVVDCWVYFLPKFFPEFLTLPRFKKFSNTTGDHQPYIPKNQRSKVIDLMDIVVPKTE